MAEFHEPMEGEPVLPAFVVWTDASWQVVEVEVAEHRFLRDIEGPDAVAEEHVSVEPTCRMDVEIRVLTASPCPACDLFVFCDEPFVGFRGDVGEVCGDEEAAEISERLGAYRAEVFRIRPWGEKEVNVFQADIVDDVPSCPDGFPYRDAEGIGELWEAWGEMRVCAYRAQGECVPLAADVNVIHVGSPPFGNFADRGISADE